MWRSRPDPFRPAARRFRTCPGSKASARSSSPVASRPARESGLQGAGSAWPPTARSRSSSWRLTTSSSRFRRTPTISSPPRVGVVGLAAWMPLSWLAPVRTGENVLVLGATGSVGSVAVQAAKVLGAGRVVAVGRDADRLRHVLELGADATVELGGDDFRERLAAAVDGAPPTVVLDAALGPSARSRAGRCRRRAARIVHVGQSAAPTATLASGLVRGKQLQILGYSNFAVPQDALAQGLRGRRGHAAGGTHPDRRRDVFAGAASEKRGRGRCRAQMRSSCSFRDATGVSL